MRRPTGLLLLLLAACHSEPLVPLTSALRFELLDGGLPSRSLVQPPQLLFPSTYAGGATRTMPVNLINQGRVPLSITWSQIPSPFEAGAPLPAQLSPGTTQLTFVVHSPQEAGVYAATVTASAPGGAQAQLQLMASVLRATACPAPSACLTSTFDPSLGACRDTPAPDGQACDAGTRCVQNATCQAGRCVGTPLPCDDGNACTVDVCHALTGCEHVPAPPCPGDGICRVGVCIPDRGCALAPAPDGTRCGPQQTCVEAQVCIEGACVVREPPEGYVCEEASPCSDEGRCVQRVCTHKQPPRVLAASWTFDSMTTGDEDAGIPPRQMHDFVMEPDGAMTLANFFNTPPILRANVDPVPALYGTARRCILWNGRLVCADYPVTPSGQVTAIDLATGVTRWNFSISAARPEFGAIAEPIFLARLVAMGSDRLAALYEAYPKPTPSLNGLCRRYFLVVLDASGRLVMAQPIEDPLLEVCNHPHPYGVTSDSVGNLYIAFSPTANNGTPLLPDRPTLLMSYTRDGIFRWKVLDPDIHGGELAVAKGLLYFENSPVVLAAPTGALAFAIPAPLGRAVISEARMIPAPVDGATGLFGYEAGLATLRWSHQLPSDFTFWGEQLRLARWTTSAGPKTVALTFIQSAPPNVRYRLHAVDVQNGITAFSCELDAPAARTPPQLFEVGDEHIGVMDGALDPLGIPSCGKCDPPFAGSSAAFRAFDLTGVFHSPDPWPGTYGGPTHDHHEKTLSNNP